MYFYDNKSILFIDKNKQFDKTQEKIKQKISEGYNVLAYVEKNYWSRNSKKYKTRSDDNKTCQRRVD